LSLFCYKKIISTILSRNLKTICSFHGFVHTFAAILEIKEKILDISEELFLNYGLKSISMDDISKQLGMSKKTVYQYIDNKKDLVEQVIQRYIGKEASLVNELHSEASDAIDEYLGIARHILIVLRKMKPTIIYDLKKYYPESWNLIETLHFQFIENSIKRNIEKGIKEELYRNDINAEIISKLYITKNVAMSDESIFPIKDFSRDGLFVEFLKYHLHGIVSEKGHRRMNQLIEQEL